MPAAAERERLVVIGNGMASLKLLEELEAQCPGRYATTVIGAEPEPAYNRVLLSSLLADEISGQDVVMRPRAWYAERGIDLRTGVEARGIADGQVVLADGTSLAFDKLILATGADPILLPLPGRDLAGVITFRTSADVARMRCAAGQPVVVIGGGLLGIEAAYGLSRAGAQVTLVHVMDRLMERQLDAEGAALLARALAAKGIRVLLSTETRGILGREQVEGIETKAGEIIPCGLVVMAVGVRSNVKLAAAAGAQVGRGIIVDDSMQTSVDGIYALGDCAEHKGTCYGLVEPAYAQARVLASVLAGKRATYAGSMLATNLKVSGVPVFSAGDFEGKDGEHIIVKDEGLPSYRKLVLRDGRLAGAVLVGDTRDALWYSELIASGASVTRFRHDLAFGRAYAEAA
ncbi:MAG: NAD(P)/FAD-dependent oxidoreductase [Hyphomicrobiales bacterium]|nr:MAG: NAD(P)/FAD-dependent oxidoreductase [Hyphomicrobiales bacterium]